jgi:hypothetical protein
MLFCLWVGRKRCVDIETNLPPFLTPLTGASVARRLDIDLDVRGN